MSKDVYLQELSMLTGQVNKDISYLYYLLIKDGSYFKKDEPAASKVDMSSAVDDFASWFEKIEEI